jgi:pilus assembly protein Flp/PilA
MFQKGQSFLEYALILILVAVIVVVILTLLGPELVRIFSQIAESVQGF